MRRRQKLLIAIDTSGSVSKKELTRFFMELFHIYRAGSEIRVVECDAEVGHVYDYKGKVPEFVSGGGGTSFEPPVSYGNKVYRPDALIYFTDGYAPPPESNARFPILWVITALGIDQNDEHFAKLPGRKVKMLTGHE